MTGGLQEQITDGLDWFGIPLYPSSKAIIGSQDVPYIYEDRLDKKQFFSAMDKMMALGKEGRKEMGLKGRDHVMKNYNFTNFNAVWIENLLNLHEKGGSWDTRNYNQGIRFKEVA